MLIKNRPKIKSNCLKVEINEDVLIPVLNMIDVFLGNEKNLIRNVLPRIENNLRKQKQINNPLLNDDDNRLAEFLLANTFLFFKNSENSQKITYLCTYFTDLVEFICSQEQLFLFKQKLIKLAKESDRDIVLNYLQDAN